MATNLTVNGITYAYPTVGQTPGWGAAHTAWATAVTQGMLQKAGGTFTLTAEVDFGSSFGLKALYYKSRGTNVSATGIQRLANTEGIGWRNAANDADLLLAVNASNNLQFGGANILTAGGGLIVNADISASAAIAYSKLNLADSIVNADVNASAAIAYSKLNLTAGIVNADINASAAIAYSKLALTGSVVNADISASAAIAYSKLSLSNSIVFGDLSSSSCTIDEDNMVTDSASRVPTQQSVKAYVDASIASVTGAADSVNTLNNLSIAASVASNELTIALKTKAGSDPSVGSPITVGFRNATLATGDYTTVSITSALSVVVPSGATLGHVSGLQSPIYVYLLNNAGAAELLVTSTPLNPNAQHTSTTISNAADSVTGKYSTTGRSNVAVRLIGRLLSTQATAGTWATAISQIDIGKISDTAPAMSDTEATANGRKSYAHGTSYNGGNAPTLTCTSGSFVVTASNFIPYRMQDGGWRMRFNFRCTYGSTATVNFTLAGILSKNTTDYYQNVVGDPNSGSIYSIQGRIDPNTNVFITTQSAATAQLTVSGDIELNAKPTWAY